MEKMSPQRGRFFTIRRKILVVAIVATLLPSLLLGWISYYQTYALVCAKATQEMEAVLERASRGMDAWMQTKFDGLRVYSSSLMLADNLTRHLHQTADSPPAILQLGEFLRLVQDQVPDYRRLLVLDRSGDLVAQSPQVERETGIGKDWVDRLDQRRTLVAARSAADDASPRYLSLGVPIISADAEEMGLLVAELPMAQMKQVLELSAERESELLLLGNHSEILLSSHDPGQTFAHGGTIRDGSAEPLNAQGVLRYVNHNGVDVVGLSVPWSRLPWQLLVEKPYASVFAEVDRLRNGALLLLAMFLAGFGLLAYLLSQSILSPLSRLGEAAAAVAEGNLDIQLRIDNRDELGFTMTIFNDMVQRLRTGRERLEKISITDSLTGLYNRKQIIDSLELQFSRYRRSGIGFSLLMVDIDHFKRINDRYGHLAGDAALQQIGSIFKSVLRNIDIAGRYGGEEFLIILEQTDELQALETAERIRSVTETSPLSFAGESIHYTVSAGVAAVVEGQVDSATSLIQLADRNLYLAKQRGRNQIATGRGETYKDNLLKLLP
ncbi:MAG: diguanylate cyclase [Gammaproteobacteria bacterium]|nr:diguanylate cyclase [Gammaproteobacteria bacterium]MCP5415609.1 diguanylate cyclase [Chromatiaceae bacterium]